MLDYSTAPKKVRCAIYTRKSTEDGLEQEFNSLDSQRDYAMRYIESKATDGWVAIPNSYDDGGYSGGNLKRPALTKLCQDIQDNKIDCVVVYKFDRLSRIPFDFEKTKEFFKRYQIKLVSVTEHVDTATPVGKLMLGNMINYAQYERDMAGERIRDKVKASKMKGMWMGGNLPLGYNVRNRNLYINDNEAKIIRSIYDYFLKNHSITETVRSMNKAGFTTKNWISKKGKLRQGKKFNKNAIERILKNQLYIGKIEHKGQIYQGLHEAIITPEIWQKVQHVFSIRSQQKINLPVSRVTTPPLLKGLMICKECGCRMATTYTSKKGKKYRYYICSKKHRLINEECKVGRVTASEVENLITEQVLKILKQPEIVVHTISQADRQISQNEIIKYFQNIEKIWKELYPVEQVRILNLLIEKVIISDSEIDLRIFKEGFNSLALEATVN